MGAIVLYPVGLRFLRIETRFDASVAVFAILMTGVLLNALYRPFLGILLQAGRPGMHTNMVATLVLINFLGNVLLVPYWDIRGAAAATASVFVLEAILIKVASNRLLSVRI